MAMTKAYSLCSSMDETQGYKNEIAFYSAIKAAFVKYSTVDKKRSDEQRNSALKLILDNAIIAEGVDDIFSMVGINYNKGKV